MNKDTFLPLLLLGPFVFNVGFFAFCLCQSNWQKAIKQSCLIKKKVVEADEKEIGLRKILNFGHTFAHAYEATLGYSKKLNHGEAVILGLKTAAKVLNDSCVECHGIFRD